jgi:two-component system, NarL family, sensor kinase
MLTRLVFLVWIVLLGMVHSLQAQQYSTPPFNFDRSTDKPYVDSLLRATRTRLLALDQLRPALSVDTARMEYLHFMAYVHYSGMVHRDSSLVVVNQLIRLAESKRNIKYQIKGLILTERYYRAFKNQYPLAIKLNYRLLALIEKNPGLYEMYSWRVYRNLGSINASLGEYGESVLYLEKSIAWFSRDKKGETIHLADLHQLLGNACKQQQQLSKAEAHYLLAWQLISQGNATMSNKAYLSNDIGRLYNSQQNPAKAVVFLKQSVTYWEQLNAPMPQADALADLAEAYAGLGQLNEAIAAAKEALAKNQKVHATRLTAYSVLIRAAEQQQRWKEGFAYQQAYNETKQQQQQAINQTESLRSKAKLDREHLESSYQQERLLQTERYQTLAKQAEIDRLNNLNKTNEFLRRTQTNALKYQLETQQLKTAATQKQAIQQATIKQLNINQLQQGLLAQTTLRNQLVLGLAIISLLVFLLLYYSLRLRRTNRSLQTKNAEIQLALFKGQTIERKRVAVELHDRVSSLLGATKMTFQTIDVGTLRPRDKQLYESSLNLLNDAASQVRQLSHNLIPDKLLQQDLAVSLRSLAQKLTMTGKTAFSVVCDYTDVSKKLPLSAEVTFNLYIICLELCTNILRHAQAQHAQIELIWQGEWLAIDLSDDGIGMGTSPETGMGLHNIRERAEAIGARFWLESNQAGGTTASIRLPLHTSSAK